MSSLYTYLLKLSICLSVVYLFYQLFLRRLTFYNWNRWYLLGYTAIAFVIPFIRINPVLEKSQLHANEMLEYIPVVGYSGAGVGQAATDSSWTYEEWILLAISIGIAIMLVRLLVQHISLNRMKKQSELLLDDSVRLYQVNKNIIPFSFGNTIFVNQHQHTQEELKEIIRHEFIHVKQRHTVDILWSEILCILNWYNPFVWLLRFAIRQNLEFIADYKVLENGLDKKEYQYLLLKVIGVSQFSIATKFNFTSLKKRIAMMNKMKSAKLHLLKFLFIIPLLAVLLLSFRDKFSSDKSHSDTYIDPVLQDTIPVPAQAPVGVKSPGLPKGVKSININQDIATVKLDNGTKEKYDLRVPAEKATYIKKYGELPKPPPPPPVPASAIAPGSLPTPPAPPTRNGVVEPIAPAAAPIPPLPPAAPATPAKSNAARLPTDKEWEEAATTKQWINNKGYILSVADNNGECIVIIKDKNRKIVKSMLLEDWSKDEKANTAKYGAIPPPPPPATPRNGLPAPGADQGIITAPPAGYAFEQGPKKYNPANPHPENIRLTNLTKVSVELQPLIILDGIEQADVAVINKLDPVEIESISILKDASSMELYGIKGKNGVILINTKENKKGAPATGKKSAVSMKEATMATTDSKVIIKPKDVFKGIYVVNGKEYSPAEFEALQLDPHTIESVNVLKGEKATEGYGDKGKEGVIVVKTK